MCKCQSCQCLDRLYVVRKQADVVQEKFLSEITWRGKLK